MRNALSKDNVANTDNNDDTVQMHKLSWPRLKIVKNQSFLKTTTSLQDGNGYKLYIFPKLKLPSDPHKVTIVTDQSFQVHNSLLK